jgi:hypothetical protein
MAGRRRRLVPGWDGYTDEWVDTELGGEVYGPDSIFDEVRKQNPPRPESVDELCDAVGRGPSGPGPLTASLRGPLGSLPAIGCAL